MNFSYAVTGFAGVEDTRHEAIGKLARFGDWQEDEIVPIAEPCLTRLHRWPEHLGNKYYGDRDYFATTHGAVRVDRETLVRHWNGNEQEVVDGHWEAKCPVCYRTHESDDVDEEARFELFNAVLDCCGVEWFPPSDWVDDCDICGEDHRGEYNCEPPSRREPFPGVDEDYSCAVCEWHGPGNTLQGPTGQCPNCDSPAVEVL